MRHLGLSALLTALVLAPSLVRAQTPSALARALEARYPEHEIVPRSCPASGGAPQGRICLMDVQSGLPRAVRRVSLGGMVGFARRGSDLIFGDADGDAGQRGASTRFAGRMWRWDLARDAYLSLGNLPEYEAAHVVETTFGLLYRLRSGWWLNDGSTSGARRVQVPEELLPYVWRAGDVTVAAPSSTTGVTVHRLVLEGDRVRPVEHASLRGRSIHAGGDTILTAETRGRAVTLRALVLPSAEVLEIALPEGLRAPTGATRIDATHWSLTGPRRQRAVLDLAARTVTPDTTTPVTTPAVPTLLASSLVHVRPTQENGLYVGRFTGGWRLDAAGATRVPRTHPREVRARCSCEGTRLSCEAGAITVPDACTEVQELDRIHDMYAETATGAYTRESLYTNDGRFRIDRLEADHVRVTRLADGARLWVRMFDDVLFAQTDDGAFFVSDRAVVERMVIRDGRSLLDAPVAPLAPREGELFRERLIADFFAPR